MGSFDTVINRHGRGGRAWEQLQSLVAAALLHLGAAKDARQIMAREPIVLPDGRLKANLDVHDIVAYPGTSPFNTADDLVDVPGVLVAYATVSFDRINDETVYDELAEVFLGHARDAIGDLDWLAPREDYRSNIWSIASDIQDRTESYYSPDPGDTWGDMIIVDDSFFRIWAQNVLANPPPV